MGQGHETTASIRVLTFDVEDWFHILDHSPTRGLEAWRSFPSRAEAVVERLLEALAERSLQATFFCLGWMAETRPALIRRIHAAGHEIGTHSYSHALCYEQTEIEFAGDLVRSLAVLEDAIGEKIRCYRAPGFSLTPATHWVFNHLIRNGIETDCSIFPAPRAHGGFPEFGTARPALICTREGTLKEFPINVARIANLSFVFSGGGYFRLFPYRVIRSLASRSPYLMTYFHPRDFDAEQPLVPGLGRIRRFKSYYGLRRAESKLARLLDDFAFVNLRTAASMVKWENVPRLQFA